MRILISSRRSRSSGRRGASGRATCARRFHAKNPRSWALRFHTQTAGCSATAQQAENNIMRTAFQALGGRARWHPIAAHELARRSARAADREANVQIALRTQQIIAYETGVGNVIDPLGGSYYVERLTTRWKRRPSDYFKRIAELGGVIPAIHTGFFQREIADASYRYQREIEDRASASSSASTSSWQEEPSRSHCSRSIAPSSSSNVSASRRSERRAMARRPKRALARDRAAAETDENLMPHYLNCVKAKAHPRRDLRSARAHLRPLSRTGVDLEHGAPDPHPCRQSRS